MLRLHLQMARFVLVTKWIPGNLNIDADALSRAPVDHAKTADGLGEEPQAFTARVAVMSPISNSDKSKETTLEAVKVATAKDPVMAKLREIIMAGFPNDKCNLLLLFNHWNVRHLLAVHEEDDMIVRAHMS